MPAGTALVGAFRTAAQIFRKDGIRVEATNSHKDCFVKNLVAIRGETRLSLAVYHPAAFSEVILTSGSIETARPRADHSRAHGTRRQQQPADAPTAW